MSDTYIMQAKTYRGLEPVLAEELDGLGAMGIRLLDGGVEFEGNKTLMYAANLKLRSATRVLVLLNRFFARNQENLFRSVGETDWTELMGLKDSMAVHGEVVSATFRKDVVLKVKDAIVSQFYKKSGRKPNSNALNPTVRVHLEIFDTECSLYLDSSGDPLSWRGWRKGKAEGKSTDALTAGQLLAGAWRGELGLLDGFCGGGQVLIEAAMIAANMAPGLTRGGFGFQRWQDYSEEAFKTVRAKLVAEQKKPAVPILGWDRSPMAMSVAGRNLAAAGVGAFVKVEKVNFLTADAPWEEGKLFLRSESEEQDTYEEMGEFLKERYGKWLATVVAPDLPTTKFLGLKPGKRVLLSDGEKDLRLVNFVLRAAGEGEE